MAALVQAEDRARCGLRIVGEHGVGIQERRRAIDEHERDSRVALAREIAVIRTGRRHDDQTVDPPRAQGERKFPLELRAFVGARRERPDASGARDVLDAAVDV